MDINERHDIDCIGDALYHLELGQATEKEQKAIAHVIIATAKAIEEYCYIPKEVKININSKFIEELDEENRSVC